MARIASLAYQYDNNTRVLEENLVAAQGASGGSPLTGVLGYSEMLLRREWPAELRHPRAAAVKQAARGLADGVEGRQVVVTGAGVPVTVIGAGETTVTEALTPAEGDADAH